MEEGYRGEGGAGRRGWRRGGKGRREEGRLGEKGGERRHERGGQAMEMVEGK